MKFSLLLALSLAFIGLLNAQNVVTPQKVVTAQSNEIANTPVDDHIKTTLAPAPNITTTTKEPPTPPPTPAPTPAPVPPAVSWTGHVKNEKTNKTCINVKFSIQVMVKYNTTSGGHEESGFDVPADAEVDQTLSYCSSDKKPLESLSINFANKTSILTLLFNRTADNQTVFLQSIDLSFNLTEQLFPQFVDPHAYGKPVKASNDKLDLFKVASVHSYTCAKALSAPLKANRTDVDVQIYFTDSKVEAYMQKDKEDVWDSEIDCKTSEISDVVPIAVGAALAGLVVIVLIAYFIGRRRSRRLAYQSV